MAGTEAKLGPEKGNSDFPVLGTKANAEWAHALQNRKLQWADTDHHFIKKGKPQATLICEVQCAF